MEVVMGPDSIREQTICRMVDEYQLALLRACYVCLHDRQLAEDAVQETFIKAYKTLDSFRGECSEKTWLMRIAVNTCRDMLRSKWFRHLDRRITPDELPEAATQSAAEDVELTLSVMHLPQKYREVTLLYYYENMTMMEIAEALGVSQSTISTRLLRARARLRQTLEGGRNDE